MWVCCWCRAVSVSVNSRSCRALHYYLCSFLWALDTDSFIHQSTTNSLWRPDTAPLTSVKVTAQTPVVARIKSFEEWWSFPRTSPTITKARVCALASTFSYVYPCSDWSLRLFFHICSAQTFSASLTRTNFGPPFSLLCNFEWGWYHKPCDRKCGVCWGISGWKPKF